MITGLSQDFRYAVRQLRKSPGFLAVVVLSLGLGIGANSTIFSVLNAVLYRPMPYDHPERLVAIWDTQVQKPEDGGQPPPIAEMNDWKSQSHVFEDIALTSWTERSTLSGLGEAEPIWVQNVTPNFFSLLGAKPVLGRISAADEMQDTTQTVVIGNSFWKRKFNGDPNALGKTFTIQGVVSTVVGVMPAGFAPFYGERIDLWQPINPESSRYSARTDHWLMPVARLKPGVTLAQAQVEMDVIARRLEQAYPATNKDVGKKLVPLHQELFDWTGKWLYPLFGAVCFVLLIACVNVANLLQSRTEVRRKEYALRAALGSGRRRLIQQLLVESALLALLGGGLGVVISFAGIELFRKLAGEFPNSGDIRVDAPVLLFTLGVSMLTAFLFGLAPAIQASRPDLNLALREGEGRTSTASRSWVRHSLAVSEVALAMLLLVGAGLMINTMLRLHRIDPGYDPKNVTTMSIGLPEGGKYLERVPGTDMEKPLPLVKAFCQRVLERVATLPGVESVGLINNSPQGSSFSVIGHPPPPPDKRPHAVRSVVSASLFRTMKIPLIKGRYLDENDTQSAPWTVVVNESFVRRYFANEDPIGQQLLLRFEPYPVSARRPSPPDRRHCGRCKAFRPGDASDAICLCLLSAAARSVSRRLCDASPESDVKGADCSRIDEPGGKLVSCREEDRDRTGSRSPGHRCHDHGPSAGAVHGRRAFFHGHVRDFRRHRRSAGGSRHLWSDVLFRQRAHTRDRHPGCLGGLPFRRNQPGRKIGIEAHVDRCGRWNWSGDWPHPSDGRIPSWR